MPIVEDAIVKKIYSGEFSREAVPRLMAPLESLAFEDIGSQEGFMLSRINGVWDVESILSICPFRDADSLQMLKSLRDKGLIGF